ncbi:MAG TPA: sugar ABC transporter permease [Rhodoglobus sp.]|jgi:simple sugar transport system permease protein/D-xylose transport system permease protein|nr:sugar ABC transporter permease [Rhodoglobus sp.]HPM50943.1 sugar ABC transporter permease [Rhodoglobus sp.]HPU02964.1 sugar ABC transporter permease [Rhodoglobus sp.]HQG71136.1 sugar ABC transporter permease [Rhodoglobus sp.]HQI66741.1 sugar ABC transporter permease [Rhodoglobus sp.]
MTVDRAPLDASDERGLLPEGIRAAAGNLVARLRGGDLGAAPVIAGLLLIWIVFQLLNPNFLSSTNLVNLTMQSAALGTSAIGVVLVLLLGEIDISVGSVSGLASAILAVGYVQMGLPIALVIVAALATGALIGLAFGLLRTRFGVPSFIITLAGLLAILGFQLFVLGKTGSINIPFDSWIVQFGQQWFLPPWASYSLLGVSVLLFAVSQYSNSRRRDAAGLNSTSTMLIVVRSVVLLVVLGVAIWYLNLTRGVGAMFALFISLAVVMHFVLTRTRWGRSVYAVGGNVEAARRAGIRVNRVYISVFMLCSMFAALGGVFAAARLAAANQGSGGADANLTAIAAAVIGGTSLFGGRGSAFSAVLGILVIMSITSGLTLINPDSSIRYVITGAVLLFAVVIDSLSRRSRAAAGRA